MRILNTCKLANVLDLPILYNIVSYFLSLDHVTYDHGLFSICSIFSRVSLALPVCPDIGAWKLCSFCCNKYKVNSC